MRNIPAYHVYYRNDDMEEYYQIDLMAHLLSTLFWRFKHGPIRLYCNEKYLDLLKKYNLHILYDEINTELLENIPFKEYLPKYWSFCKTYAAYHISQTVDKFVILDNDMWLREDIGLDYNLNFIAYHKEAWSARSTQNPYAPPSDFLTEEELKELDFKVNPVNCAFMYFNSKELVEEWYKWANIIIERWKDREKLENNADTIFIEQRLLPVLTKKLDLKGMVILPNTYLSYVEFNEFGTEWFPLIDSTQESYILSQTIRHIWGLKSMYDQKKWRNTLLEVMYNDVHQSFDIEEIKEAFNLLFSECEAINPIKLNT